MAKSVAPKYQVKAPKYGLGKKPAATKGSSASTSNTKTNIPAAAISDPMAKLNERWTARLKLLDQQKGVKFKKHVAPAIRFDKERVARGDKPLNDQAAYNAVFSLVQGKPIYQKKQDHGGGGTGIGLLDDAIGDVEGIVSSLPKIPATLANDVVDYGKMVAGGKFLKGGGIPDPKTLAKIPLVRLFPGVYTAANIEKGDWGAITHHPIYTALDVLPYAAKAGKIATAGAEAAEGGAVEALQEGRPFKALNRVPVFRTKSGIKSFHDIEQKAARGIGVSKDIREAVRGYSVALRRRPIEFPKQVWDRIEEYKGIRENMDHIVKNVKLKGGDIGDSLKDAYRKVNQGIDDTIKAGRSHVLAEWIHKDIVKNVARDVGELRAKFEREVDQGLHKDVSDVLPKDQVVDRLMETKTVPLKTWMQRFNVDSNARQWLAHEVEAEGKTIRTWVKDVPKKGLVKKGEYGPSTGHWETRPLTLDDLRVPDYFERAFKNFDLEKKFQQNLAGKIFDKSSNVFKYAVLTGPRHVIHILSSSVAQMLLGEGPKVFRQFKSAVDMVRDPKQWSAEMSHDMGIYQDTDWIGSHAMGKSQGKLYVESRLAKIPKPLRIHKLPEVFRHTEEFITNTSRAMVYLEEKAKAAGKVTKQISKEEADQFAHEAGINGVNRVLMDLDGMAPIERVIIRRMIPFYAFEKQLIRIMTRFPGDHPFSAAVLSTLGRLTMEEQNSGLPEQFGAIFFLGDASENGKINSVDMSNFNPFRSMAGQNPLSLAGFLSSMSPWFKAPLEAVGVNTLSATPDLFPELTVDPYTGNLVARHSDTALGLLKSFLPPINTLDGIIGFSQQMKDLKASNPDAYRRMMFSSLNLPAFVNTLVGQGGVDVGAEKADFANKWFGIAQQDASQSVRENDPGKLSGYSQVPYYGKAMSVDDMKKIIQAVNQVKKKAGVRTAQ